MKRSFSLCLVLCLGALAGAVQAEPVFIPIATDVEIDGIRYQTQIWVTNQGDKNRRFSSYFIGADTDGTVRDGEEDPVTSVSAGATIFVSSLAEQGATGMLEITPFAEMIFTARLQATRETGAELLGARVPVISESTGLAAGSTAHLQAWRRDDFFLTDFGIINLSSDASECTIEVFRANGNQIGATAIMPLKPLSLAKFDDVLGIFQEFAIGGVRATVSCDQTFYTYAYTYNRNNGDLTFIRPALVQAPGGGGGGPNPPAPPPSGDCSGVAGSVCFEKQGVFHQPTGSEPHGIFNIPVPPNTTFGKVTVDLDVTHGGWYGAQPDGAHNIFWLNRGEYRGECCYPAWPSSVYGYVNARGPNRNLFTSVSNINLPNGQTSRFTGGLSGFGPGGTYHVRYEYNGRAGTVTLQISQNGNVIQALNSGATANAVRSDGSGFFMIYVGNRDERPHGPEVPSFGWRYANLRVEFVP